MALAETNLDTHTCNPLMTPVFQHWEQTGARYIPAFASCVGWKGTNSTHLEDPGIYIYIFLLIELYMYTIPQHFHQPRPFRPKWVFNCYVFLLCRNFLFCCFHFTTPKTQFAALHTPLALRPRSSFVREDTWVVGPQPVDPGFSRGSPSTQEPPPCHWTPLSKAGRNVAGNVGVGWAL